MKTKLSNWLSFDTLNKFSEKLSVHETQNIRGGDFVGDLIQHIFHRQANVTNEQWNMFVANITDLASTKIGHDVLNQLLIANTEIKILGDQPGSGGSAAYQWSNNSKKILIGNYDVTMSSEWSLDSTAHEIYHAFQDIVKHTLNSIAHDAKAEIDAQLFARMAEVEYDADHGISLGDNHSRVHAGIDFAKVDPVTSKEILFKNAWDDILKNHNFTLENYNILVNNFIGGSVYSSQDVGVNSAVPLNSLNATEIDDLFFTDFNGYKLVNTFEDNGGGGNDSYGWDAYANNSGFSSFMQNIWGMQNQGYVFYTSSYTVYEESYFPTQYGNGWMWATQDPIINNSNTVYEEPNMTEWFAFYNSSGWESNPAYNGGGWGNGYMASYGG